MKTKLIWLIVGLVLVGGITAGGYYYVRPRMASTDIINATTLFLDAQKTNDQIKYQDALNLVDRAIRLGKYDSTVGLFRGQVLAALGRKEEAKQQYEKIKQDDKSAIQAVDSLISQL